MQNIILIFLHLGAAAVALGAMVFGTILAKPIIKKSQEKVPIEESLELKLMDLLAPTVLACVYV